MLTERDIALLGWIARLGGAGREHVMGHLRIGRSQAHARLAELSAYGLIERRALLYRRPALYLATREGLRFAGHQDLGAYRLSPAGFEHTYQVARVAVALAEHLPGWRLLGEREVRAIERERSALFASIHLGEQRDSRLAIHRPDLALIGASGSRIAVEVELSVKAPRRLAVICRGWARARHADEGDEDEPG